MFSDQSWSLVLFFYDLHDKNCKNLSDEAQEQNYPIKHKVGKKSSFLKKIMQGFENVRLKVSKHLETVDQKYGINR